MYVGSNPVFFINQSGIYNVMVTDANGCTAFDDQPMTFYDILIPNFFTPVSDGWTPLYLDNYPNAVTYVFDRYSRKLATLRPGQKWDGTYEGNALPSGDYWYVLKLNGETDTREFVGNVALYR
ncbi:MAG: T9SS type B sorting domain-containing protein [Flavobacterium sp.]|nr:T9SS type B sorting domain-containing protein [Flavobacterium sp.]